MRDRRVAHADIDAGRRQRGGTEALATTGWRRIRLSGVRVGGPVPLARQLELFSPRPLKEAKLSQALNALEARFGEQVVRRGSGLATPAWSGG